MAFGVSKEIIVRHEQTPVGEVRHGPGGMDDAVGLVIIHVGATHDQECLDMVFLLVLVELCRKMHMSAS